MEIEGEPLKQWSVWYGGDLVGDWDTAQEAWDGYQSYEKVNRPVSDRDKRYRYSFRDGRNDLDIDQFRAAIAAEKRALSK